MLAAMAMKLRRFGRATMVTFAPQIPWSGAALFHHAGWRKMAGRSPAASARAGAVQEQVVTRKERADGGDGRNGRLSHDAFRRRVAGPEELSKIILRAFATNPRTKTKLYFRPQPKWPVLRRSRADRRCSRWAVKNGRRRDPHANQSWTSFAGIRRGMFQQAVQMVGAGRRRGPTAPVQKNLQICTSPSRKTSDRQQWAKRNTSYGLAGSSARYPDVLKGRLNLAKWKSCAKLTGKTRPSKRRAPGLG